MIFLVKNIRFGFPGGGIDMDESILKGLAREYREETGVKVKVSNLLGISEDFFTSKGVDAKAIAIHGILIYYEVKKIGGEILPNGNGEDTGEVKFIEIDKFNKENSSRSQWKFIKNYLKSIK